MLFVRIQKKLKSVLWNARNSISLRRGIFAQKLSKWTFFCANYFTVNMERRSMYTVHNRMETNFVLCCVSKLCIFRSTFSMLCFTEKGQCERKKIYIYATLTWSGTFHKKSFLAAIFSSFWSFISWNTCTNKWEKRKYFSFSFKRNEEQGAFCFEGKRRKENFFRCAGNIFFMSILFTLFSCLLYSFRRLLAFDLHLIYYIFLVCICFLSLNVGDFPWAYHPFAMFERAVSIEQPIVVERARINQIEHFEVLSFG